MAQVDMFLKLDGINGESEDSTHPNEIQLYSFTFGVNNQGAGGFGKGSGASKSDVHDIVVTKLTDMATAPLMKACATGKTIGDAVITIRKAGGDAPVEYLKADLKEVFVSQFHLGATDTGGIAQETVGLNFSKVEFHYTPQDNTGAPGATVSGGYDIKKNEPV